MSLSGSDDHVIEGINSLNTQEMSLEEAIETNRDDIETVQRNQRRMYALQQATHQDLRGLFYRGMGVLVSLLVALMGMISSVLIL